MTLSKEELDAMFAGIDGAEDVSPDVAAASGQEPHEAAPGSACTTSVPSEDSDGKEVANGKQSDQDNDTSWVDDALADEPDPMAPYESLKKVRGFTDAFDHPEFGRVVAVAYFEVLREGVRWRFNAAVNGISFFDAPALDVLERRGLDARMTVKLIAWTEGTVVRRWGNRSGAKDDPKHSMRFVVRGDQLVRR